LRLLSRLTPTWTDDPLLFYKSQLPFHFGRSNPGRPSACHLVGGMKAHGSVLLVFQACSARLNSARLSARCFANSAGRSRKGVGFDWRRSSWTGLPLASLTR